MWGGRSPDEIRRDAPVRIPHGHGNATERTRPEHILRCRPGCVEASKRSHGTSTCSRGAKPVPRADGDPGQVALTYKIRDVDVRVAVSAEEGRRCHDSYRTRAVAAVIVGCWTVTLVDRTSHAVLDEDAAVRYGEHQMLRDNRRDTRKAACTKMIGT